MNQIIGKFFVAGFASPPCASRPVQKARSCSEFMMTGSEVLWVASSDTGMKVSAAPHDTFVSRGLRQRWRGRGCDQLGFVYNFTCPAV